MWMTRCHGNYCVMTNINELQACCPHSRKIPDASQTTGYFWKLSCGWPEAASHGATCRRNSANGTPCSSGSDDGQRKASGIRHLPHLRKMPISKKPSWTAPSSKPTSMPLVLQKERRQSAWPLAQPSCAWHECQQTLTTYSQQFLIKVPIPGVRVWSHRLCGG